MKIRILISKILIVITFFSTIIFSSCSDDSNPTSPAVTPNVDGMIRLSSAWAEGAQANVIIYVEDTLHQGYNPVHIVLYDSLTGALITNSHVSFDIVNHGNNVPVENPEEDAVGGIFTGAFILNGTQ
ncbi:MAG: hypothetical protein LH629_06140, partial [Ignavibacteria bacterium]|nr:hypothetical protein [Ignavibacteria bacterium]